MPRRIARCSMGARRNSRFRHSGMRPSGRGSTRQACAGTGEAGRPASESPGRTGSPTRRCRPRPPDGRAIEPVIPPCRVERPALEASESGQVRRDRVAQRTTGEHEHIGGQGLFIRRDPPVLLLLVPLGRPHVVVEANVRQQVELPRAALQVRPDLRLPGKPMAPSRFERERKRVQVRLDVAGAPGIRVVTPGAPDVAGSLQHDEVVDALALQPDGGAKTGEAAADDRQAACMVRVG